MINNDQNRKLLQYHYFGRFQISIISPYCHIIDMIEMIEIYLKCFKIAVLQNLFIYNIR